VASACASHEMIPNSNGAIVGQRMATNGYSVNGINNATVCIAATVPDSQVCSQNSLKGVAKVFTSGSYSAPISLEPAVTVNAQGQYCFSGAMSGSTYIPVKVRTDWATVAGASTPSQTAAPSASPTAAPTLAPGQTGAPTASTGAPTASTGAPTASTASPTGAPTAAATEASHTVVQSVSVTGMSTSNFDATTTLVYERSYAITLGIWDSATNAYKTGNSVTLAVAGRRAVTLTYTATVAPAQISAATTAATALENDASTLVNNIAAAKTSVGAAANSVNAPPASSVTATAPQVTAPASSSSSSKIVLIVAAAGGAVVLICALVVFYFMCCNKKAEEPIKQSNVGLENMQSQQ